MKRFTNIALIFVAVAVAIPVGLFATGVIGVQWAKHVENKRQDSYHLAAQRLIDFGTVTRYRCDSTIWVEVPTDDIRLSDSALDVIRHECGTSKINVTDSHGNILQTSD